MTDDDVRRLLRTIDGADDDVPPEFADGLWADVRATIVRGGPAAQRHDEDFALLDSDPKRVGFGRVRPWLGRAAVLVLIAAGVTGLVFFRGGRDSQPSDVPPVTTVAAIPAPPPILDDPAEACRRFEEAGPFAELSRRMADLEPTVTVVPELETAAEALIVFIRDLEVAAAASSAVTAADVAPFRRALDSLEQAQLEVELGELDRAGRSVDAAVSLVVEALAQRC